MLDYLRDQERHRERRKRWVPSRFQIAASCPMKDKTEMGRLLRRAWMKRIPPWMPITT